MLKNIFESLDKQFEDMEHSASLKEGKRKFNAHDFKRSKYFPLFVVDDTDMDVMEANDYFGGFIENMSYDINPELDWFDIGLDYGEQGGSQIYVKLKPDENNYGEETIAIGDVSWDLETLLDNDEEIRNFIVENYEDEEQKRLLNELATKQKQVREEVNYISNDLLPKLASDWGFEKIEGIKESSKSKYIFDRRKLSESCRSCPPDYAEKAFNAGATIYATNGTKSARMFVKGSQCKTFKSIAESFANKDKLVYIVDTKTVNKSLNESIDKNGKKRYNGAERCLKEGFYKCKKDYLKESRKPLNEGPGAGYSIQSTVKIHNLKNLKVSEVLDYSVSYNRYSDTDMLEANVRFTCDTDCDIEDLRFESYGYGGDLDGSYSGKIFELQCSFYVRLDEYGIENAENWSNDDVVKFFTDHIDVVDDACRNEHFSTDITYGGGWVHVKYDGTVSTLDDNDWVEYGNSSYNEMDCDIEKANVKLTDNQVIEFIDKTVSGDTQAEEYFVLDWDDDVLAQFDTLEEAKKWIRDNPDADTAYVEVEYMQQDLNGDWETYSTDVVIDLRYDEDEDDDTVSVVYGDED